LTPPEGKQELPEISFEGEHEFQDGGMEFEIRV